MGDRTLSSLSLPAQLAVFAAATTAVWFAGVAVSDATDRLSRRYGLGEALGGMIGLAIVTNLPELAIVGAASVRGNMDIAIGNILGGIAIQTVVLALLDLVGLGREAPLAQRAASPVLVLEGLMVIAVLALSLMGHYLPATMMVARVTPPTVLIALVWCGGLWLIRSTRQRFELSEVD
jgi:cation:H+ antiporter